MIKVLFVCLGNICRSPLAEGVFNHLINEKGLAHKFGCDSCGTSNYHIGEQPDPRTSSNAKKNGITLVHSARQFSEADFHEFDYIVAMDSSNFDNIKRVVGNAVEGSDKLLMIREFDQLRDSMDVPDPYYGGSQGFQNVFDILMRSCNGLLQNLSEKH